MELEIYILALLQRSDHSMIAFVNSGSVATTSSSYTVGGGQSRLLVLYATAGSTDTQSAVTYGGQSMTLIAKGIQNSDRYGYLWYLLNPPSGSNAFSITDAGFLIGECADYTGVLQTTPNTSGTAGANGATSIAKSVTTTLDNCWLIGGNFCSGGAGGNWTMQGTAVIRKQNPLAVGNPNQAIFDSNADQTPAGSHSLGIDFSIAWTDTFLIVAAFAPAPPIVSLATSPFTTPKGFIKF